MLSIEPLHVPRIVDLAILEIETVRLQVLLIIYFKICERDCEMPIAVLSPVGFRFLFKKKNNNKKCHMDVLGSALETGLHWQLNSVVSIFDIGLFPFLLASQLCLFVPFAHSSL